MIRYLRHLIRDKRGVSAVEFALILPLMVTMYFGTAEVSQGISIDRKLSLTARTVADLASQVTSINDANMNSLLKASVAVMSPYPDGPLGVTVSLVEIEDGKAKIKWSKTLNGTSRAPGDTVTLPPALLNAKTGKNYLVWGEAKYAYKPTVGYTLTGTINLSEQLYMRPRLTDGEITRPAS